MHARRASPSSDLWHGNPHAHITVHRFKDSNLGSRNCQARSRETPASSASGCAVSRIRERQPELACPFQAKFPGPSWAPNQSGPLSLPNLEVVPLLRIIKFVWYRASRAARTLSFPILYITTRPHETNRPPACHCHSHSLATSLLFPSRLQSTPNWCRPRGAQELLRGGHQRRSKRTDRGSRHDPCAYSLKSQARPLFNNTPSTIVGPRLVRPHHWLSPLLICSPP